jgi:hypothetical protein
VTSPAHRNSMAGSFEKEWWTKMWRFDSFPQEIRLQIVLQTTSCEEFYRV